MKIALMGGIRNIKKIIGLFQAEVEIVFFIDNNARLAEERQDGKKIYTPYRFPRGIADYIVIFIYDYMSVKQELNDLGVEESRILCFHEPTLDLSEYENLFQVKKAEAFRLEVKVDDLCRKIEALEESRRSFERNCFYEAADLLKKKKIRLPYVKSVEDTCQKILAGRCSLSRYGDGEFEIIAGHAKDVYQSDDMRLAERLREILISNLPGHLVAIADDYGAMEGMREENKNTVRKYMTPKKREEHYALLDMDKEYYNAYISRPYVIYPHHETEMAGRRFRELRRIWENQDVLFIEGDKTRMGAGNDLFGNAAEVARILAPNENAFDVYDSILEAALAHGDGRVILIALGPTATVLAYDLAKAGYQALDIGHLDLEYEWFLKGKGYSYIPHKYNNEMPGDTNVTLLDDKKYEESVICRIR